MMASIKFLALIAGICLQLYSLKTEEDDIGNANDYVDEVLQNLRNEPSMMSKLDPFNIPEVSDPKFELKEGVVHGLSSLYRHGDCTLEYDGDTVKATVEVGVRDVTASARYRAKALFFWIKGHVDAELQQLALRLQLSSTNGVAHLESFKVITLGEYKIKKITGMSVLLNWLLKLIANSIAKKSRGKIIDLLENEAAAKLGDYISKMKFPSF